MAQPVVHFEVMGRDGRALQQYYGALFDWQFDASNEAGYGVLIRGENGIAGIGGGVGSAPPGYAGHVTVYVGVPDVEAALARAESLGGKRMMGPQLVSEGVEIGQFTDPEGHLIGLIKLP